MADSKWEELVRSKGKDPSDLVTNTPTGNRRAFYDPDSSPQRSFIPPGLAGSRSGPQVTMYTDGHPWTRRQYAGYGDARETNKLYRRMYDQGERGFSIAFDIPTQVGYASDDPLARAEVGMSGVALDSAFDYAVLFNGIPLSESSVSMTINGAVLQSVASLVLTGEAQGVDRRLLRGTIQNDPLKEHAVRNAESFGLDPSMRIAADIIEFAAREMPKFNPISISGYHYQEAGATGHEELAFMLADAIEYVRTMKDRGIDVDDFAPQLSFFFSIGIDFYGEIAKHRAARELWDRYARNEGAVMENSRLFRFHSHTSGLSLQAQDPNFNILRAGYEAMSAVFGGTQSMHISSYEEAVGLPSTEALRTSQATHHLLLNEMGIGQVIDPWKGSFFMEELTDQVRDAADDLVQEILEMGGMKVAIESGFVRKIVDRSAAIRAAGIDRGTIPIVGVNMFKGETPPLEPNRPDAGKVLRAQEESLAYIRSMQDPKIHAHRLERLGQAAREGENLMPFVIDAMRDCATWGDITETLEREFGKHQRILVVDEGTYGQQMVDDLEFNNAGVRSDVAAEARSQPLKMLLVTPWNDGHDHGPNVVASGFRSLGFEVEWNGVISLGPDEIANSLTEGNFDVLGISSHGGTHVAFADEMSKLLRERGLDESVVIALGGVVPLEDYGRLKDAGVDVIIPQGATIAKAANDIMDAMGIPEVLDSRGSAASDQQGRYI